RASQKDPGAYVLPHGTVHQNHAGNIDQLHVWIDALSPNIDIISVLTYPQFCGSIISMEPRESFQPHQTNIGRVERRRAKVRAQLLEAARQVFLERGYQDATITGIVQVADIAMGTFYLHFRDKEELLVALAQDTLQVLREQVHAAIEQHANAPLVPLII